jgi:hypothetical protein
MSSAMPAGHWLTAPAGFDLKRYVYRYIRLDGLIATLQNRSLRLSAFATMNDPREARTWSAGDLTGAGRLEAVAPLTVEELQAEVDRVLRRGVRVACFGRDRKPSPPDNPNLFHRGWANSSMWHHYADQHRGACMVFDAEVLRGRPSLQI